MMRNILKSEGNEWALSISWLYNSRQNSAGGRLGDRGRLSPDGTLADDGAQAWPAPGPQATVAQAEASKPVVVLQA